MQQIQRILLSRMKFIGDIVLTTPVIRAVRERYPSAYIAYLGDSQAVSLLEGNPCLDEILPYDFSKPSAVESFRMILKLRKRKFDVAVDLFSNPRTALLMYGSGAPIRIGKQSEGRGRLYTHQIKDDGKAKTAIQFHYQYVRELDVEPIRFKTEIFLSEQERLSARNYVQEQVQRNAPILAGQPIVGINPGATWPSKIWLKEHFAELASRIVKQLGAHVVLFRGPKDGDLAVEVAKLSNVNATVLPPLPLRKLAAVLSSLSVYVTNDNGAMHIAVATGTATIGVFGQGEENIWFPYSAPHVALRKDVPCHPCHLEYCNRPGDEYLKCMKLLSVDEVFTAVKERMAPIPA